MIAGAPPRDAATVVLLRDGPAGAGPLEVLLLERPASASFAPRAWVFPGGAVEAADRDPTWAGAVRGGAQWDPRAPLASAIAAVRECFEETGILLATGRDRRPVPAATVLTLRPVRERVRDGDPGALRPGLGAKGLRPDLAGLVSCARWITPVGLAQRYDTRFFLARLPDGQSPAADPRGEHVRYAWAAPRTALALGVEGVWQLLPPTRAVLASVADHPTPAAALAATRARPVTTVVPTLDDLSPERHPGLDPAVVRRAQGG